MGEGVLRTDVPLVGCAEPVEDDLERRRAVIAAEFTDLSKWMLMMFTILFELIAATTGFVLGAVHLGRSVRPKFAPS